MTKERLPFTRGHEKQGCMYSLNISCLAARAGGMGCRIKATARRPSPGSLRPPSLPASQPPSPPLAHLLHARAPLCAVLSAGNPSPAHTQLSASSAPAPRRPNTARRTHACFVASLHYQPQTPTGSLRLSHKHMHSSPSVVSTYFI